MQPSSRFLQSFNLFATLASRANTGYGEKHLAQSTSLSVVVIVSIIMLSPESLVRISTALCLASLKPCKTADHSGIHFKISFQISCLLQLGDRGWADAELYASKVCVSCLQLLKVHKLLEKGLVTDGTGALWRDVEVVFVGSYSVFSNKERLSVLFCFA